MPPNGLELSRSAARGFQQRIYDNAAGKTSSHFCHASRVGFSELLGGFWHELPPYAPNRPQPTLLRTDFA